MRPSPAAGSAAGVAWSGSSCWSRWSRAAATSPGGSPRDEAETFADPVAQFKYGSTGGDRNFGLPYVMWEAMPSLFRDLMPEGREDEGWAAFGFIYEEAADLPPELRQASAGRHLAPHPHGDRPHLPELRRLPCRQRRTGDGAAALVIAGMPSNTVDLSAFQGFLARAAVDERFSADRFLAEIDALGSSSTRSTGWRCKFVGVGMVRERLLAIVDRFDDFVRHEPTFGPGRFDTFNPAKALLNWDFDAAAGAGADRRRRLPGGLPAGREGGHAAALGRQQHQGQRAQPLRGLRHRRDAADPRPRVARSAWRTGSTTAEPPRFPEVFPGQFDAALAARARRSTPANAPAATARAGATSPASYVGKVTPIAEIGTDRARLDNYTHELAVNQNVLYAEYGAERFQTFRKTDGYANAPLDGVWLRAPYLHNGSVPTWRRCCRRRRRGRGRSCAATTSTTRETLGFVSEPARIDPALHGRLFCYVTRADGARPTARRRRRR